MECQATLLLLNVSILQEGILPIFSSGRMIKNEPLFMKDGSPCYTAKTHMIGCSKIVLRNLWPRQSRDMNPVKDPWAIL